MFVKVEEKSSSPLISAAPEKKHSQLLFFYKGSLNTLIYKEGTDENSMNLDHYFYGVFIRHAWTLE